MSRNIWLYIAFIFLGSLFSNASTAITYTNFEVEQDSLKIDNSTVNPRKFDNLNDIYTGEDYIYERSVENSGWWTRFKNWLNHWLTDLLNLKDKGQASDAVDIIINICGVIIFLLVIYFIFKAIINKEGSWVFGKYSDKSIIPISDIENNIHAADFKTLIASAENEANYRLAIRYYYLWLLKELSKAELITYDVEKTNSDYQNEIAATEIKEAFTYASYLYNYIWYGEFNVNEAEFIKAKKAFQTLIKTLNP